MKAKPYKIRYQCSLVIQRVSRVPQEFDPRQGSVPTSGNTTNCHLSKDRTGMA